MPGMRDALLLRETVMRIASRYALPCKASLPSSVKALRASLLLLPPGFATGQMLLRRPLKGMKRVFSKIALDSHTSLHRQGRRAAVLIVSTKLRYVAC